jgi:hypothetical protein
MKKVHKMTTKGEAPCGAQLHNVVPAPGRPGYERFEMLPVSYRWSNVTCKKCLRSRKTK